MVETRWYMFPQPIKIGNYELNFQTPFLLDRVYVGTESSWVFWPQGPDQVAIPISRETYNILETRSTTVDIPPHQLCPNRRIPDSLTGQVSHERNSEGKPVLLGDIDRDGGQIEGSRAPIGDAKYFLRQYAKASVDYDLPLIIASETLRAERLGIDVKDDAALHDTYPALYWAKAYIELRAYQATKGVDIIPPPHTNLKDAMYDQWFVGSADNFHPKQYYINLIDKRAKDIAEVPLNLQMAFEGDKAKLATLAGIEEIADSYLKEQHYTKVKDLLLRNCYRLGVKNGLRYTIMTVVGNKLQMCDGHYATYLVDNPNYLVRDYAGHLTVLALLKLIITGAAVDFDSFSEGGRIDRRDEDFFLTNRDNVSGPTRITLPNSVILYMQDFKSNTLMRAGSDRESLFPVLDAVFTRVIESEGCPEQNHTQWPYHFPSVDTPEAWQSGLYQDAKLWILLANVFIGKLSGNPQYGVYQTQEDAKDQEGGVSALTSDINYDDLDKLWDSVFASRKQKAMLTPFSVLARTFKYETTMFIDECVKRGINSARNQLGQWVIDFVRKNGIDDLALDDVMLLWMTIYSFHSSPKELAKPMLNRPVLSPYYKVVMHDMSTSAKIENGTDFIKWVTDGVAIAKETGWSEESRGNNVVTDAFMQLTKYKSLNLLSFPMDAPADAATPIVGDAIVAYLTQLSHTIINDAGLPNYSKVDALIDHSQFKFLVGHDHRFRHTSSPHMYAGGSIGNYVPNKPMNQANGVAIPFTKVLENKNILANMNKICVNVFKLSGPPKLLSPEIFQDLEKNSKHLGLLKPLPTRNLLLLDGDAMGIDTKVMVTSFAGQAVALIIINSKQLVELFGGFNTCAVLQALTHEIGHYYEMSYIKNSDRLRFEKELGHKQLYPSTRFAGHAAANKSEQFAILAEYMVWGSCARAIYYTNGADTVQEYFANQYLTKEMLAYKR